MRIFNGIGQFTVRKNISFGQIRLSSFFFIANCPTTKNPRGINNIARIHWFKLSKQYPTTNNIYELYLQQEYLKLVTTIHQCELSLPDISRQVQFVSLVDIKLNQIFALH